MSYLFVGKRNHPVTDTEVPVIPTSSYAGITIDDYDDWLKTVVDYRTSPIYLDAANSVSYYTNKPIVAARSMCGEPSVDGGYATFSPNALIRDRYYNLVVTATGNCTLNSGHPTDTLNIAALDRALPAGFVLDFTGGGIVQLTTAAALGATNLSVARIYTDVAITTSQTGAPINGTFAQKGTCYPKINDVVLVGDPNPLISRGFDAGRKYSCDGIAISAMGTRIRNVNISNFNGHGVWVSYPYNSSTVYGISSPWDVEKLFLDDITVANCFSGVTVNSTDPVIGTITAREIRDYGVRFNGFANQVGTIHAFGCGTGVYCKGNVYADKLQGETSGYGVILGDLSDKSQISQVRAFNNTYVGLAINVGNTWIGSAIVDHSSTSIDGNPAGANGVAATGYSTVLGSYADSVTINYLRISCTGNARGLMIGNSGSKTIGAIDLSGVIIGSTGTYGIHVPYSMTACNLNFVVGGFTYGVYFGNTSVLTANRIILRGPSATTIRWADSTTGTFDTPNIPTGVNNNNYVSIHPY